MEDRTSAVADIAESNYWQVQPSQDPAKNRHTANTEINSVHTSDSDATGKPAPVVIPKRYSWLMLFSILLLHAISFANLTISISEITYLVGCMNDDWIVIMVATPFHIAFRVILPDCLFSSRLQENTFVYNSLWLAQIAVPLTMNIAAVASHEQCVWFFESDIPKRNVSISYVNFNETAPVLHKTSTEMTRIVMTIGKNAVPLSMSVTFLLVICWNMFLRWGKRNRRRLSSVLKENLMGDYGENAGTVLDTAAVILSRIS